MSGYGGKELASAFTPRLPEQHDSGGGGYSEVEIWRHVAAPRGASLWRGCWRTLQFPRRFREEIHKKQRMTTLVGLDYFGIRGHAWMRTRRSRGRRKSGGLELLRSSQEKSLPGGWRR